ncbi:pentapeptide repeat-containing protein [Phormidesmis sp. 146-33]
MFRENEIYTLLQIGKSAIVLGRYALTSDTLKLLKENLGIGRDRVEDVKGSPRGKGETVANQELLNSLKDLSLLEGGVEAWNQCWNQWRQENLSVKFDFSNVDLSGTDLSGTDLSNTNLSGANLSNADLSDVDLSGTDLSGADLSNTNLSGANLSNADLSDVDLSGTDLSGANLNGIDLSGDKLSRITLNIDDLLGVSLKGVNLSGLNLRWIYFDGINPGEIDLSGIDFRGVNLSRIDLNDVDNLRDIDLTSLDLSDANLRNANLSGINLNGLNFSNADLSAVDFTKTQALATNFTGAILTGACLEDWNTNSKTNLDGVICDYVYLKQKQQERRPSSGTFKPGEFTALFQKALETVDLIFADGIDWQAFFQSFQELRSQYNDLSIQAIEKKSGGAFVIRLEVPPEANKAAIENSVYEKQIRQLEGRISEYREEVVFLRQNVLQSNTNMERIAKIMADNQPKNNTTIYGDVGFVNSGDGTVSNFSQNIGNNINDITKLISVLRHTAQTFPQAQREEALVHLDDLQEDLSQPEKQKPQRIKTRLVALFAIATTVSGLVAGAADFSNNVLELSEKLDIELIQPHSK